MQITFSKNKRKQGGSRFKKGKDHIVRERKDLLATITRSTALQRGIISSLREQDNTISFVPKLETAAKPFFFGGGGGVW